VRVLRESPNATTGILPFMLQYGICPHGVLSLLKDNWTGFENLPKSKSVGKYLSDLRETLKKNKRISILKEHKNSMQNFTILEQ